MNRTNDISYLTGNDIPVIVNKLCELLLENKVPAGSIPTAILQCVPPNKNRSAGSCLPSKLSDLTLDWCTATFGDRLHGQLEKVEASAGIGEVPGFSAVDYQIQLHYKPNTSSPADPSSVYVKLGAPNSLYRFNYDAEMQFYRELSHRVAVSVPRVFAALNDTETGQFALVLENLIPLGYTVGNCLNTTTWDRSVLVVQETARLHCQWFNRAHHLEGLHLPDRLRHFGKGTPDDNCFEFGRRIKTGTAWLRWLYKESNNVQNMTEGEKMYKSFMPPKHHMNAFLTHLQNNDVIFGLFDRYHQIPKTLIHSDVCADNIMFNDKKKKVKLLDWQAYFWGPAVRDIAFFVSSSWDLDTVTARENELIWVYWKALKGTLSEYAFEKCWEDYKICRLWVYIQWLVPDETGIKLKQSLSSTDNPRLWNRMRMTAERFSNIPIHYHFDQYLASLVT